MALLIGSYNRAKLAIDKLADHYAKKLDALKPQHEKEASAFKQTSDKAISQITPIVRRMLLTNLKAAGVRRGSGLLERAIGNATVWHDVKRNRIMVGFAPNLNSKSTGTYKGKRKRGKGSPVYVYGSALNFGAVHAKGHAGVLGGKLKRTLKNIVLFKKIPTKKQLHWLQKAGVNSAQVHKGKSISGGSITVIKPRNFFQLNAAQSKYIAALYSRLVATKAPAPTAKAA